LPFEFLLTADLGLVDTAVKVSVTGNAWLASTSGSSVGLTSSGGLFCFAQLKDNAHMRSITPNRNAY
jgi:hypothetical protein